MHYLNPKKEHARVLILYRNFSAAHADKPYCHVGLGVNALHTAKVLRRHGVQADIAAVWTVDDVRKALQNNGPTHAIVEAPWISAANMQALVTENPWTHFVVRSHSQIGFLQVEAGAIQILRELLVMQEMNLNLTVAANTKKLKDFFEKTYGSRCLYLPNLYDLERVSRKRDESHQHRKLRVASFGALRLLKNHTTAAAAALLMAERRQADLEFHVNVNREENAGAKGILQSIRNMFNGLTWAKLVEVPWAPWASFRHTVRHMDLCLQASHTETFNIVTADAIAEGVPSVTSSAIEWVPKSWHADADSAEDIARVGSHLLWDTHGAADGLEHLERFCKEGIESWLKYLDTNPT